MKSLSDIVNWVIGCSFLIHKPTYAAAIKGHPISRGRWLTKPMKEDDAIRIATAVTILQIGRWYEERYLLNK